MALALALATVLEVEEAVAEAEEELADEVVVVGEVTLAKSRVPHWSIISVVQRS